MVRSRLLNLAIAIAIWSTSARRGAVWGAAEFVPRFFA